MQEKGMPTLWFTLSAADNHWQDLHKLVAMADAIAANAAMDRMSELLKVKKCRKWIKNNPHIVDCYFHKQVVELYFKGIFGKDYLNAKWLWHHSEYQKRGCAHIHGCCCLKSNPNLHVLAQNVAHGREAQLAWTTLGDPHPLYQPPHFMAEEMEEDKIVRIFPTIVCSKTMNWSYFYRENWGRCECTGKVVELS
jgi:Helitron helicase-like domain at N-terminus